MPEPRMIDDAVHQYMHGLTTRLISKTGNPTDRYHLGKIILQSLMDAPDFVLQINGLTGESETCGSIAERSVRCAKSLRNLGLGHGDVMVLMAPNHLDVCVPLYAAFYLGIIVSALDWTLPTNELQQIFAFTKPAIIFCQTDTASKAQEALFNMKRDAHIITFDKGNDFCNFSDLMEKYSDDIPVEDFKCADFDPEESTAFIVSTSGTTGLPKGVAHSHKYFAITMSYIWARFKTFPTPTRLALITSPLQWSTAITSFIRSPIMRYTRLQTPMPLSLDHAYYLINTYRPTYSILSPTWMTTLLKPDNRHRCDFTSFELLMLCGLSTPQTLIEEAKTVSPNTEILNIFGMSELAGLGFYGDNSAPQSCGKPMECFQYRLINPDTKLDVYESNVPGELWIKGPCPFKGYFNDIEATKETYTKDGWLKTGDIFYRDENSNYFYVERLKLQLKCLYVRLSPLEIEGVIRQHPGVLDVAVTSVPHTELGDLPVACVVPRPGAIPSAEEIKNLVKNSLHDAKRLRGGVIFIDSMPMTATTKIHRRKLKQMALELPRA
uniref:Luciferin 4-monooxygenase n=1 Tax=Heliothis virescens TaxID=7102 RepID=A0A2A4JKH2_HELVI